MMNAPYKPTILFITSAHKGDAMIREVKAQGCYAILITEEKLKHEPFPYDVLDEVFYLPELARYKDVTNMVSWLCRGRQIDAIVPLDEFEVEIVAMLREHLRIPGMGVSNMRHFRDKLTMRELTQAAGIRVPPFAQIKNYDKLREYMAAVPTPYMLKPRMEAGSMGLEKIHDAEQLWRALDRLGDNQSHFLVEKFVPGDIYHADSIVWDGKVQFVTVSKYGAPPFQVYHGGGVFMTRLIPNSSKEAKAIKAMNTKVIKTLNLPYGVTHAEYIQAEADGEFYFLEIAARVGGANIADVIEAGTGLNPFREWGRIEVARLRGEEYVLPEVANKYAGILMTLARQQYPDLSSYTDSEIVWRADKEYHAGLIASSDSYERLETLMGQYLQRFGEDFMTRADPWGTQRTGFAG
jgi:biotin carboxylase